MGRVTGRALWAAEQVDNKEEERSALSEDLLAREKQVPRATLPPAPLLLPECSLLDWMYWSFIELGTAAQTRLCPMGGDRRQSMRATCQRY